MGLGGSQRQGGRPLSWRFGLSPGPRAESLSPRHGAVSCPAGPSAPHSGCVVAVAGPAAARLLRKQGRDCRSSQGPAWASSPLRAAPAHSVARWVWGARGAEGGVMEQLRLVTTDCVSGVTPRLTRHTRHLTPRRSERAGAGGVGRSQDSPRVSRPGSRGPARPSRASASYCVGSPLCAP